jgi:hypothetical protein
MSDRATKTNETHLSLDAGLDAFRRALAPQEGQFMRGATVILNPPKDTEALAAKPSRNEVLGLPVNHREPRERDINRLARNLLRDAGGRWLPREESDQKRNCKE